MLAVVLRQHCCKAGYYKKVLDCTIKLGTFIYPNLNELVSQSIECMLHACLPTSTTIINVNLNSSGT